MYYLIPVLCGVACWERASKKNRSAPRWALLGLLFGPFALIALVFLPAVVPDELETERRIPCADCGESILTTARKCRYCGYSWVDDAPTRINEIPAQGETLQPRRVRRAK